LGRLGILQTKRRPRSDGSLLHRLGFSISFRDDGWMMLDRGAIAWSSFQSRVNPRTTTGSACALTI
jgi:hypothetical protein